VRSGGPHNEGNAYFEYDETWTQNLTVTLDRPGRLVVSCDTPRFEPHDSEDFSDVYVRSIRLTATRLPQTPISRQVQPPSTLSQAQGTIERRPPSATSIQNLQGVQESHLLSAIGRALRHHR
jgi:hypothetical protein